MESKREKITKRCGYHFFEKGEETCLTCKSSVLYHRTKSLNCGCREAMFNCIVSKFKVCDHFRPCKEE
jgi:hypothetical protein